MVSRNARFDTERDEAMSGCEWMAAKVRVRGEMRAAIGEAMNWKQRRWMRDAMRRGAMMRGRRTRRARKEWKERVPKMVVVECEKAARVICVLLRRGMVCRWKYHWETVADEVALELWVRERDKGNWEGGEDEPMEIREDSQRPEVHYNVKDCECYAGAIERPDPVACERQKKSTSLS